MNTVTSESRVAQLVAWYEALSPESLESLATLYHPQAHFRDPFNNVRGCSNITEIFRHMFRNTEEPKFTVREWRYDRGVAWLTWDFNFNLRGSSYQIEGATRVQFDQQGLVQSHIDYWDALPLFESIPVLGKLLHLLKRRMSASIEQHSQGSNLQ